MSGIIKFDDEHIVKFTLDAENLTLEYLVIIEATEYTDTVTLEVQ